MVEYLVIFELNPISLSFLFFDVLIDHDILLIQLKTDFFMFLFFLSIWSNSDKYLAAFLFVGSINLLFRINIVISMNIFRFRNSADIVNSRLNRLDPVFFAGTGNYPVTFLHTSRSDFHIIIFTSLFAFLDPIEFIFYPTVLIFKVRVCSIDRLLV